MNKDLSKAVKILKSGGLILYPSDTYWSIACDASNESAVQKLINFKQVDNTEDFNCLVADERMLKKYVKDIPQTALNIIEVTNKPTSIIYDDPKNIASQLVLPDNSLSVRIPDDDFCYWLCRKMNGAIATTSANIYRSTIPKSFKEIAPAILKDVDYVVNLHSNKIYTKIPSIIKLSNNGMVKIVRA